FPVQQHMILRPQQLLDSLWYGGVVNREAQSSLGGRGFYDRKPHRSTDLPQDLGDRHPRGVDRDEPRIINDAHLRLGSRHSGGMARQQRDAEKDGWGSAPHLVLNATLVDPLPRPRHP